jgi:peptidyl-prolyl cis-trans isomerase C
MAKASARHILVQDEDFCVELKAKIEAGEVSFEEVAREHSLCPSGARGGELGTFMQGQMVPEFDEVVFNGEIGSLHGPIRTDFGYHLLEVKERHF